MLKKSNRRFLSLFVGMVVVLSFIAGIVSVSTAQSTASGAIATITVVTGNVKVAPVGQVQKVNASKGMLLSEGDTVYVGKKSYVAIVLVDGSAIKLNQQTALEMERPKGNEYRVNLPVGQLWARVIKGKLFSVRTPTCVASVRGTELDINVTKNDTQVLVYDGVVEVRNDYGMINVTQGQKTVVKPETIPPAPVAVNVGQVNKWQDQIVTGEEKKEEPKTEVVTKEEQKAEEQEEAAEEPAVDAEQQVKDAEGGVVQEPVVPPLKEASPFIPAE